MNEQFIKLSRGFFSHPFWQEERDYSRAEAWLDMLQSASWKDEKRLVKTKLIAVARGELIASQRFLGQRWRWSPMKVQRFLDMLKPETMITAETRQGESVITICNFDFYDQGSKGTEQHAPSDLTTRKEHR